MKPSVPGCSGGVAYTEEMRRLLGRAVSASSNGIIITDPRLPDNPIVYVNPAFERTTGYSAQEVLGRNCRFLQGEERDQEGLAGLRSALVEGRESRVVLKNFRKDGTLFWNELYVSPVFGEGGVLSSYIGVQNDITDRRRIEEVLRASEDRLRLAVGSTGIGTWDFDPTTGELRWDERCRAMFGLPPDAPVDYDVFLEGLHPEDRERTDQIVRRALDPNGGGSFDVEYRTIGIRDGVERWVAAQGQAFFERGRAVRFIGTVLDITERRRAEEERDLLLVRERLARSEAVAARRRLGLLAAAGPVLSASLDYEETLGRISRLVVPSLADMSVLDIVEDGEVQQLGVAYADPAKQVLLEKMGEYRRFDRDAPGYAPSVMKTGRSLLVSEVDESVLREAATNEEHLRVLLGLGIRSFISVPLIARGRTLGALSLISTQKDRLYDDEDLALAEGIAYRCALAVDNARTYREQSFVARTMQRSLLPELPEVPGVEVGVEYLPVGEENEVGGDFYDLMHGPEEGGTWISVIGDVRGKGAVAAAVTALARYTVQAVALREDAPARLLNGLNAAMRRQLPEYQYCTVACASLRPLPDDPAGRRVEVAVARAGHPPPLVLRADGSVEEPDVSGRALGLFPDAELEEDTFLLGSGDAVLLYTDGVTEARSPEGGFFGEERLNSFLASCAGLPAVRVAAELRAAVLEFQEGEEPRDDLAIMVLRVC